MFNRENKLECSQQVTFAGFLSVKNYSLFIFKDRWLAAKLRPVIVYETLNLALINNIFFDI